jgi:hypothetical protein
MSASNIISHAERTRSLGDDESLSEVLDFLVTEEQLGVTLVSAAIENAPGTPSEAFLPVLRNGVTQEYLHVEALKEAGGKPLTTRYWFLTRPSTTVALGCSRTSRSSRRSRSAYT